MSGLVYLAKYIKVITTDRYLVEDIGVDVDFFFKSDGVAGTDG